ncbi:hypothetical protein KM176_11180 [Pseudooceanicola sp. CBS1P-1]|uniref:DUF2946 domain-containing protein n=1 Tax=Pseudooceanicola albus TaxID=2692189 RepID=A0A6L7GAQ7_9RHOB|nr:MULTISPECIES: hypothetical protein [Pseudooceanicola]MBT9384422.1 hypothetical protein [Pseudooceanicola endophyticus]MXN20677.1 hypothetical protein [Pseudooceanicola albus]
MRSFVLSLRLLLALALLSWAGAGPGHAAAMAVAQDCEGMMMAPSEGADAPGGGMIHLPSDPGDAGHAADLCAVFCAHSTPASQPAPPLSLDGRLSGRAPSWPAGDRLPSRSVAPENPPPRA